MQSLDNKNCFATESHIFYGNPIVTLASHNHRRFLGYSIIVLLMGINIFRAHTQSITHDEAFTYNEFVSHGWATILLSWHTNNHTFQSLLIRLSTSIFGLSHLSIRIPALLGGLIYLLSVERLCRKFCQGRVDYLLYLLFLASSPFILDFLIIARGYSLALGFFMLALLLCGLELYESHPGENRTKHFWTYFIISCLCALSVASNLGFAFVIVSLLVVFFTRSCLMNGLLHRAHSAWKKVCYDLMLLVVPGAILFLWLNPVIFFRFDNRALYYGSQNWPDVFGSIVNAVFDDFAKKDLWIIPSETGMWIMQSLLWILGICMLFGGIDAFRGFLNYYLEKSAMDANQKLWMFVFAIVAVTIILHSVANTLFGVLLPMERTGIFFVPLVMLLSAIAIGKFRAGRFPLIFRSVGRLTLLLVVVYFLSSSHMNYFRNWKYDSGTKDVFLTLRTLDWDLYKGIGINWLFEPSLNFYRLYYQEFDFLPFTRHSLNSNQEYFILRANTDEDRQFIRDHNIRVIYQHPVSKAIIGIKE